jgi:ribonuclease PH
VRADGRTRDELRPVKFHTGYQRYAEGSVLVEIGDTRVLCSASVEDNVPQFRKGTGSGWITAEYSLLPRSTLVRCPREASRGRVNGRTHEIQRVIGRCLRAVVNLDAFGERTVWIDCDVLQADGGTRTAAITGGYVALALAVRKLQGDGLITADPLLTQLAGISVGVVGGEAMLDLVYSEDFAAEVDFNVAMTGDGRFVEVQGNAEGKPFDRGRLDELLHLAETGIEKLLELQREALAR